ncbi:protein shisa-5 isoform X2 [Candoia aspera]|uniref:protein shisa-5 isoform X2 n=1 Tax=Candoia aspera TaxID=51853 RepID=UPI002FD83DE5
MAFAWSPLWSLCALVGLLLPPGGSSEYCEAYEDSDGHWHSQKDCMFFCCGTCDDRYCCSNAFEKNNQFLCSRTLLRSGTIIAIGVSIFILFVVTIILCFTCSCCCLYKACRRRPQPVVTTATTVVQVPYPQQPGIPAAYPGGAYQGYNPLPVQPQLGMPAAPYPTQYPPPYPTQPVGPPPYHETVAAGAGAPAVQPPYNPAYMDPPKGSY